MKFIVASKPNTEFPHWKQLFYIDTRNQIGWGDCDDIFSSSPYKNIATKYDTEEAAQKWNQEFLQGEGIVIPA